MDTFFIVVAVGYGLVIGSFLNAVVYRVPRQESLNTRSHCPRCEAKIVWWQNVPIVSYLLLRGRCAGCSLPISLRYPAVELAGAVAFGVVTAWAQQRFDVSHTASALITISLLALAAATIALTLIDIEHHLLPTAILKPVGVAVVVGLTVASLIEGDYDAIVRGLGGLAALGLFYGAMWAWKPGAMGFGDVRLSLIIGFVTAWFSWPTLLLASFLAFGLAAIVGVTMIVFRRASGKTALPFGPFMLAGLWVSMFCGQAIIDSYLSIGGLR